jgi:hypothetical protein
MGTSNRRWVLALVASVAVFGATLAAHVHGNGFGTLTKHDVMDALGVDASTLDDMAVGGELTFKLGDGDCMRTLAVAVQTNGHHSRVHGFWFYGFTDTNDCVPSEVVTVNGNVVR